MLVLTYALANFAYLIHAEHRLTAMEAKIDTLVTLLSKALKLEED